MSAVEPKELVAVRDVSFSYGLLPVLENISFAISPGDFLAVLGPNGSGKTTLLKIILGLLKPSEGEVILLGKPVENFSDRQKIGYVPQKATHIDPYFPVSVREVVAMTLYSSKTFPALARKEEAAIVRALKQVGMESLINRPVGSLSGGQQQRVFIARAIVNQPHILFLDEPTAGVDADTQEHFYEMLAHLNKNENISIVLVTHDIGIVNRHINKVACLNQTLVYHGSHEEFCRSEALKNMIAGGHHYVSHRH